MGELLTPHVDAALRYAHQVVAGEIPACKWVKAACQRQLDDLERWSSEEGYPFDWRPELAERRVRYIQLLRHVKGRWAGQRIVLEPWQQFSVACVFGWVRKDTGLRRFRTVYEEVPRKNAKTTKLAGIGLSMLTDDGEWGAEVYSAATTRDQAKIVFEIAQQMARMDGEFRARFGVEALTHSLWVRSTASKMTPLSAEGSTLDGLNVSCALIDELHAHKTRAVHDVLDSATGSRAQPLIWKITTAGSNRAGVCYDQRDYLTKILNSTLRRHGGMGYRVEGDATEDDSFWGIIYTIDGDRKHLRELERKRDLLLEEVQTPQRREHADHGAALAASLRQLDELDAEIEAERARTDDPLDESSWIKANPNYGISVDPEDMRRAAAIARVQASALNEFLTKRLDVWVNADASWMNMLAWDACGERSLRLEDFAGEPCVVALDAAFKRDLFAKVRVFVRGNVVYAFGKYYAPQALLESKGNEQLLGWSREGWIRATPGEVLDIEAVREDLIEDSTRFQVQEVPYDPAQLTQFATEMLQKGIPMVEIRPTVLNFSPAMKELDELVAARRFVHAGDPVLAWAISNVVCHRDAKDNIYPRKERAETKIDPAIALIMAIARAVCAGGVLKASVYEERGVLAV
jgi:phage terminase large subunit-like protein